MSLSLRGAACAAASVAALTALAPAGAWAQAAAPAAGAGTGAAASTGEVVVTGSRIARRDFTSDSPIVTKPAQDLARVSAPTLDQALADQLPQITGVTGQTQTGAGFGQIGAATLNLRNLGENRNLVLMDGRRMEPSTTDFAVDINSIPSALIDSVEVITGGASAVYGSDAVAGVVNFKLKHNFEGLELDAKGGISGRGDYGNTDDSVTAGANFADGRGNVVVSLDYLYRAPTYQRNIPFYQRELATGSGTYALSFLDLGYYQSELDTIPGTHGVPNWPGFPGSGPVDYGINSDRSTLFNIATGQGYTSGYYPQNPNYAFDNGVKYNTNYNEYATTPMQRYSAFTRFEYKLTDDITAYGQLLYTHYNVDNVYIPLPAANFWSIDIPFDAAHPVPASLASVLASRPDPVAPWHYSTSISFLGIPITDNVSDVYQALVGLKGDIGASGWTWDVYASHGSTSVDSTGVQGYVDWNRWQQLLEAPGYGAGFNNGAGASCTSGISPFMNPGSISQDCRNYLEYKYHNALDQSQDIVEATLQGKVTDLPAGELRVAVGADYRRNTLDSYVDPIYETNPQIGSGASSMVGTFAANSSSGSEHVYELYGEALVPILRDAPLVKSFDVDLAYRYSNYNLSGGVSTYAATANWKITEAFSLRGGYQRAVRAPNVTELFSSAQAAIVIPAFDPCVNVGPFAVPNGPYGNNPGNPNQAKVQALCTALTPNANPGLYNAFAGQGTPVLVGQESGNPNLKPEKADTFTFGAVFRARDLPWRSSLQASIDYYNIKVSDAIEVLDPNQTYQLCFNAFGTNPTYSAANPYCQIIARAPGNGLSANVYDVYQNQGGIKTSGVDLNIDWRLPAGPGTLDLNGVVNYLGDYKRSFLNGLPFVEYADTISSTQAYFRWRPITTVTYALDNWTAGLRWRFTPRTRDVSCAAQCDAPPTASYSTFDLFGSYALNSKVQISGGIDNLFDRDPPVVGGVLGNTNLGEYDVIGRQLYLALKAKF